MGRKTNTTDNATRRLARLAAVQGLYQIALSLEPAETLISRFCADPCLLLQEDQTVIEVDGALFGTIISGVIKNQDNLDAMIAGALDARLSAKRLELLLKIILRAGAFELHHSSDIPEGIIVNDYVDVAHGFFNSKEPALINAVLDRLAKKLRS
ncbi:MAG: transcription antitermination factor NusB [Bdellovibrionales bacterium]